MAPTRITFTARDRNIDRFHNQIRALGETKGRVAMARAINRAGDTTNTAVKRALQKQTSIPRRIINRSMKTKRAAQKGGGALEYVITGRGKEIPLKEFNPRQFSYGVRARVWGKLQQFKGMFGAPGDNPKLVAALGGHVYHRTSADRFPIERGYGPSVPKEMVEDQTAEVFQKTAAAELEKRLAHEIGRLLGS